MSLAVPALVQAPLQENAGRFRVDQLRQHGKAVICVVDLQPQPQLRQEAVPTRLAEPDTALVDYRRGCRREQLADEHDLAWIGALAPGQGELVLGQPATALGTEPLGDDFGNLHLSSREFGHVAKEGVADPVRLPSRGQPVG